MSGVYRFHVVFAAFFQAISLDGVLPCPLTNSTTRLTTLNLCSEADIIRLVLGTSMQREHRPQVCLMTLPLYGIRAELGRRWT